jgi:uncharacterized protein
LSSSLAPPRVTLVTGASSGIGRELARLAAADGGTLVLVARRRERLEALAAELTAAHPGLTARPWPADLAAPEGVRGLLAGLAAEGLAVDHLVNNAGLGGSGRFHRLDPERERQVMAVNVVALHALLHGLLPGMVERGYGRVLNVASTAAFQPLPYLATYAAGKAFVLSLSAALWQEYRGSGVTVTCLCPGKTATEFFPDSGLDESGFGKVPMASAGAVARAGYRGMMAGRRLVVPGLLNKLSYWLIPLLPLRAVLKVGGGLFRRRRPK